MELKIKDFILSVFKFSIATWVNFAVGLLMTIITTRLFDEETYAVINIFNTATTTGMTVVCLGLDSGYIRFFHEPPAGENQRQLVCKLMLVSSMINFCSGAVLLFGYYRAFSLLLFNRISLLLCIVLFLNIQANLIVRFLNITYRMRLDARGYTIQNILFQSSTRLLIIVAAILSTGEVGAVLLSTVGMLLLAIIYLIIQRKDIFPEQMDFHFKGYQGIFKYSIFSAPTVIIINLNLLIMNLIVKEQLGLAVAGIYSSSVTIAQIINVLQGGFSTFWSGYMFAYYQTAQNICKKVHDYFVLGMFVIFMGLVLGKKLIFLLVGRNFQSGQNIFALLIIYPLVTLVLETTGYGVSIAKKTYVTMLSYLSCLLVNITASMLLVKSLGMKGIALSSSLGAIVLFVILTENGQKYYGTINKKWRTYTILIMIEILAITNSFYSSGRIFYSLSAAAMVYVVIIFRTEIKALVGECVNALTKEKQRS